MEKRSNKSPTKSPTSSSAEPRANRSYRRATTKERLTKEECSYFNFLTLFEMLNRIGLFGKTSLMSFASTKEETSEKSSKPWTKTGIVAHGTCILLSHLGCPPEEKEFSWSDFVEDRNVPQWCYLTPVAHFGILKRLKRDRVNIDPKFAEALDSSCLIAQRLCLQARRERIIERNPLLYKMGELDAFLSEND